MTVASTASGSALASVEDLAGYQGDGFDSGKHVQRLLEGGELAACVSRLSFQLASVQKCMQDHVSTHYGVLIDGLRSVQQLHAEYVECQYGVLQLTAKFHEVDAKVREPYAAIKNKIQTLANVSLTCSYLRYIKEGMLALRKLKLAMDDTDKSQAAKCIVALRLQRTKMLAAKPDLLRVIIVQKMWTEFDEMTTVLLRSLNDSLSAAVKSRSSGEGQTILTALLLVQREEEIINGFLKTHEVDIQDRVARVFDLTALAKDAVDKDPSLKSAEGSISLASLAKVFWNQMIDLFDITFEHLINAYSFDGLFTASTRVLSAKLWKSINVSFQKEIQKSCTATPAIVQIMQGSGYHRLLRLIGDNQNKLMVQVDDSNHEEIRHSIKEFTSCFSHFETAYLSRSLARMFDPINSAFGTSSKGVVPTVAECSNIVKLILAEIDMVKFDGNLNQLVLKNVGKAMNLLVVRCESMLDNDPASFNILISPFPTGLVRNLQICNIMSSFLQTLNLDSYAELENSYENAEKLFDLFFAKLSRLACRNFEAILFRMQLDSNVNTTDTLTSCLNDLEKILTCVRRDLLQYMQCFFEFNSWLIALLKRIVVVFSTCVALLKPTPQLAAIKNQCERLQTLINGTATAFQINLNTLADSNNLLKAIVKISETSLEHIASHQFKDPKNLMIAVHILFSRGPVDLKPPHKYLAMPLDKYVSWIDQHSLEEWKVLMEKALNAYVKDVDSRGSKTYAQEYVTILKLLKRL